MILSSIEKGNISFPIDIQIHNKLCYIVSVTLPRQYFKEPFILDSLSNLKVAEVNKTSPAEQSLLVRPLHYDVNDSRIKLVALDNFVASFANSDYSEDNLGFIFHTSRCGSTLITQMLASSERFFVVSEPPIITKLLDPAFTLDANYSKEDVFRSIICAINDCKPSGVEFTFIKFRSWNTLFINKILERFPHIRWAFIHRNGLEVLESVLRDPPGWLRARGTYIKYFAPFLEIDENILKKIGNDEYVARMLGIFCRKILKSDPKSALLLDYKNLKNSFFTGIKKKWNIFLTDKEMRLMDEVSKLYSKDKTKKRIFEPDSDVKRAKANQDQKRFIKSFTETERLKLINTK